jgi:hypothetical protein
MTTSNYAQLKTGELLPMPEIGFKDEGQLEVWASSSSFGGGRSIFLADGVYAIIRSRTSGRASSEIVILVKKHDTYRPQLIIPTRPYECEILLEAGILKIHYHVKGKNVEFLRLSMAAMLD